MTSRQRGPEGPAAWAASYSGSDGIRPLFAPIADLSTGAVVAVEVVPRPRDEAMAGVVAAAARTDRRAALDVGAAAAGIRRAGGHGVGVPLHVTLLADTLADDGGALAELHAAVRDAGIAPRDLVVRIAAPIGDPADAAVEAGARALRSRGYGIGVAEVGPDDHPLALVARVAPEVVALDPGLAGVLDADPGAQVVLDAVARLCRRIGADLVASGIATAADLEAFRRHGVRRGCGPLLGAPGRRPVDRLAAPLPASAPHLRPPATGPTRTVLGDLARPAVMLRDSATGSEARTVFQNSPDLGGVVLTTASERPVAMLERNRFLLAVSARFGYALHADRPVRDLAEPARVLPLDADPRAALELGDSRRAYDDIAVVDDYGRCRGVVRVGDLLRAVAAVEYDRALALHPVTGLPGVPALTEALEQRLLTGRGASIGLVTADLDALTRNGGFDAVVDGLRRIARALTDVLPRFAGSLAAHGTGDDLVVVTDPGAPPALDAALHTALAAHRAPRVATAWLRRPPGTTVGATDVARELARLREQARRRGPDPAVTDSAVIDAAEGPPRPLAG
ncbi:EAL domain-containing protein [Pseudonocardia sp. RS010]|uniref:EAL domain-containing protein n=1 Tax=Pseudonocardia sp. RS010 TaxID=3385979 RepID=UPI0039A2B518